MKTKWTKEAPKKDGWYWVKYFNERVVVAPALKISVHNGWIVRTACNVTFYDYRQGDLKFGNKIEEPKA